jgi:hypothetical protein
MIKSHIYSPPSNCAHGPSSENECGHQIAMSWRSFFYLLSESISIHCLVSSIRPSPLFSTVPSFSIDPFHFGKETNSQQTEGTSDEAKEIGSLNDGVSREENEITKVELSEKDEEIICRALCFALPILWLPQASIGILRLGGGKKYSFVQIFKLYN